MKLIKNSILTSLFALISFGSFSQTIEKEINISDTVKLKLQQIPFDSTLHDVYRGKHGLVDLIDGKLVFGTDGIMPRNQLSIARLIVGEKVFQLKVDGMYDPNLEVVNSEMVAVTQNYSGYTVRVLLSVGAGYYGVEWTVIGDKSYRTILTNDWKILDNGFVSLGK